jgi:octaprenyl-diphosphate synthase
MNDTAAATVVPDAIDHDPFAVVRRGLLRVEQILQAELHSSAPFVDELLVYVGKLGGKRLRPALVLLTGQATGDLTAEHDVAAAVMEMIHLATLVHDDVLDNAHVRRHQPTVHRKWGKHASILLGDHLFSRAFHLASTLGDTYACRTIGLSTNVVCEGELLQLSKQGRWDTSEEQYFQIIRAKTAELCACCCRLGSYYSQASPTVREDLERFGYHFGLAFQMADDLLDVTGNSRTMGKDTGTDWECRQLTLPVIHHLQSANGHRHPLRDLRDKRQLHDLLRETNSLDYARKRAVREAEEARAALASLPRSESRRALESLCNIVATRTH